LTERAYCDFRLANRLDYCFIMTCNITHAGKREERLCLNDRPTLKVAI